MTEQAEVWILHRDRRVLCSMAGLGVPRSAIVSSDGTIGGTFYQADCLLGPFEWGEAREVAMARATELGYTLDHFNPSIGGW